MSIQNEITRITSKRNDSFTAVANKGVTVPSGSTIDDLPGLIALIQTGSGGSGGLVYQDENGYVHLSDTGGSAIGVVDTLDTNGGTIRNIYGIDLSNDTVTAADLMQGVTAHNAQGQAITGTASGGGSGSTLEGDYLTLRCAIVTVGANSVTNATQIVPYLLGLAGFPTTDYTHASFCVIGHSGSWVNNAAICTALESASSVLYPASAAKFYRFRNDAVAAAAMGSSYDATLTSGDKYFVSAFYVEGVPT